MDNTNNIINLIKTRKEIPKNILKNLDIDKNGNCLYRTFSYFLYYDQEHYNEIRQKIYEEEKKNKNEIK